MPRKTTTVTEAIFSLQLTMPGARPQDAQGTAAKVQIDSDVIVFTYYVNNMEVQQTFNVNEIARVARLAEALRRVPPSGV